RPLSTVDVHGAEFAGVVDTQDLVQADAVRLRAGSGRDRPGAHDDGFRNAAKALSAARPREISAFQPAMDNPRNTQAALSQAGGAERFRPFSRASRSAGFTCAAVPLQDCGPGQNFHSAPA